MQARDVDAGQSRAIAALRRAIPEARVSWRYRGVLDGDDIGAAAAYLLSAAAGNVTPTTLYVDAGYHSVGM